MAGRGQRSSNYEPPGTWSAEPSMINVAAPPVGTGVGRGFGRGMGGLVRQNPPTWNPPQHIRLEDLKNLGRGRPIESTTWESSQTQQSLNPFSESNRFRQPAANQCPYTAPTENTASTGDWNWPIAESLSDPPAAQASEFAFSTDNTYGFGNGNGGASSGGFGTGFNSYRPRSPVPSTRYDPSEGFGSGFNTQASEFGSGGGFGTSSGFNTQPGFGEGEGGFSSSSGGFGATAVPATSTKKKEYEGGFKKSKNGFGFGSNSDIPGATRGQPPILKNFYVEDPEIAGMSDEEVKAVRLAMNRISVEDVNGSRKPPNPVRTFGQAFGPYPEILEQIEKQGFTTPSPIQCQMWPIVLNGHDCIGIAQTGTGKTLAFLLPIFIHLDNQPTKRENGPGCVVLTPTRELAQQIHKEVKKYQYKMLKSVCVYGGAGNRQHQIQRCEEGMDIVIATPGRLQDLVEEGVIDLWTVTCVVLDECDRMLDMGFEPEIRSIIANIRDDRQTVLTSATWPQSVRQLALGYMQDPFLVTIGSLDLAAVHSIIQQVFVMERQDKKSFLFDFLAEMKQNEKVIIFVATKKSVDYLASDLKARGYRCQYIHGDRDQVDREKALKDLAKGTVRILVATDVASRGLDISDITHVFNYDFPTNIEEYVHRVGRTGRAGKAGVSITIMTESDKHHATKLVSILMEANQDVPKELLELSEKYEAMKAELGAELVDPQPFRRPRDKEGRRVRRERNNQQAYFDPYTGEEL